MIGALVIPYVCPTCSRASYHPEDARHRFCGVCGFEDDPAEQRQARADAVAASLRPPPRAGAA
jgi:plasmid replication initiation protein